MAAAGKDSMECLPDRVYLCGVCVCYGVRGGPNKSTVQRLGMLLLLWTVLYVMYSGVMSGSYAEK